jgi:hypothetical protein
MTSSKPPLLRAWAFSRATRDGWIVPVSIEGQGEGVLRLHRGESTGGADDGLADLRGRRGDAGVGQELVEQFTEQVGTRQGQVEAGDLALQFGGRGFQTPRSRRSFPLALAWRRVSRSLRTRTGSRSSSRAAKSRRSTRQSPSMASTASRAASGSGQVRTVPLVVSTKPVVRLQAWRGRPRASAAALTSASARTSSAVQQKKAGVTGPRVADEWIFHGGSWDGQESWGWFFVEVLAFPAEAGFAGGVGEDPVPGVVEDLPLLGGVVELDLGGADDFEGADLSDRCARCRVRLRCRRVEVQHVGDVGGHDCTSGGLVWVSGFCCWFFWRR